MERKYSIVHTRQIVMHDSISFIKSCESLSFLVRDVVHITPENFHVCVAAIRTFVEASYKGEMTTAIGGAPRPSRPSGRVTPKSSIKRTPKSRAPERRVHSEPRHMDYDADEEEEEDMVGEYAHVTMQLLDLMHTLHSRAAGVHEAWAAEGGRCAADGELWDTAWCPVLQGMARLCCDRRSEIRTQALTLLQRSLLVPDLQILQPNQWEFCFLRVLFPMLRKLLEPLPAGGGSTAMMVSGREETKLRAAMMLSKVFLQHLGPLSSLPTFTALWLTILDFLAQFVSTARTDLLADALPESLKNMLLVMDTSGQHLFFAAETGDPTPLWTVTWEKIDTFLPNLKQETFGDLTSKAVVAKSQELAVPVDAGATIRPTTEGMSAEDLSSQPINNKQGEAAENSAPSQVINKDGSETEVKVDASAAEPNPEAVATLKTDEESGALVTSDTLAAEAVPVENDKEKAAGEDLSTVEAPAESAPAAVETSSSSSVFSNIANYFGGSVISAQPISQADPSLAGQRIPSLPADLQSSFGPLPPPALAANPEAPPPLSPADPPVLASSAFNLPTSPASLPTSPAHKTAAANALFTPISKAPAAVGVAAAAPLAAPTPAVVAAPVNPVIMAPVASPSMGILATAAFSPTIPTVMPTIPLAAGTVPAGSPPSAGIPPVGGLTNPLLAPAAPLPAFQTTVSAPCPPDTDTV